MRRAFMLILLSSVLFAHGGTPPIFNSPDIVGECYDGSFEYESFMGAEILHFSYSADNSASISDPHAYSVVNGHGKSVIHPCGGYETMGYKSAGELGESSSYTLRNNPMVPLADGSFGLAVVSHEWVPLHWLAGGWTALDFAGDPSSLAIAFVFNDNHRLHTADGDWIGWRRNWTNGTHPGLLAEHLYYTGVIVDGDTGSPRVSGTWQFHYTKDGVNAFTDLAKSLTAEDDPSRSVVYDPPEASPAYVYRTDPRFQAWRDAKQLGCEMGAQ